VIDVILLHLQFVLIFLSMAGLVLAARKKGLLRHEYREVFERLVTELALPIVIFSSLVSGKFEEGWLYHSGIFLLVFIVTAVIAWAGCRAMKISRKQTGTIILVASFGSSATLAAPFISAYYGTESVALAETLFDVLVGVAVPFSTLGVLIAAYFGSEEEKPDPVKTIRNFVVTPVFIAFVLGLLISILASFALPELADAFTGIFDKFFSVIGGALELLIWISIGLMLKPVKFKVFLPFLGLVVLIKMIIQPLLMLAAGSLAGLPDISHDVMLIMAAAPSGAIAAVLADRYGCDGRLAGAIVMATYLISLVTFPVFLCLIL
jgi:predicted permease